MENKADNSFVCSKFTKGLCITSLSIYAVVGIVVLTQAVLGGLLLNGVIVDGSSLERWIFRADYYSYFLFAIEVLVVIYCLMGIAQILSVLARIKRAYVSITDEEVFGFAITDPSKWQKGREFRIKTADIVSTGITEARLYGRTRVDTLIISTADDRYSIPALTDPKAARKEIEKRR